MPNERIGLLMTPWRSVEHRAAPSDSRSDDATKSASSEAEATKAGVSAVSTDGTPYRCVGQFDGGGHMPRTCSQYASADRAAHRLQRRAECTTRTRAPRSLMNGGCPASCTDIFLPIQPPRAAIPPDRDPASRRLGFPNTEAAFAPNRPIRGRQPGMVVLRIDLDGLLASNEGRAPPRQPRCRAFRPAPAPARTDSPGIGSGAPHADRLVGAEARWSFPRTGDCWSLATTRNESPP